jgi:hypothetical protein
VKSERGSRDGKEEGREGQGGERSEGTGDVRDQRHGGTKMSSDFHGGVCSIASGVIDDKTEKYN